MSIRLLALDLDGTLLNSRGELSERNFQALAAAREVGVRVALVTGRRFRDARPLALQLGLDVPVISHNNSSHFCVCSSASNNQPGFKPANYLFGKFCNAYCGR